MVWQQSRQENSSQLLLSSINHEREVKTKNMDVRKNCGDPFPLTYYHLKSFDLDNKICLIRNLKILRLLNIDVYLFLYRADKTKLNYDLCEFIYSVVGIALYNLTTCMHFIKILSNIYHLKSAKTWYPLPFIMIPTFPLATMMSRGVLLQLQRENPAQI